MIKLEVDSKRTGGTDGRPEYCVEIKNYEHEGTVEQMISEMGAVISRWLTSGVGGFLAEKGEENFDAFCALIEQLGKVTLLSALASAAMRWAEEHGTPVEIEDLAVRFAGSLGGTVQDEPAQGQYVN